MDLDIQNLKSLNQVIQTETRMLILTCSADISDGRQGQGAYNAETD